MIILMFMLELFHILILALGGWAFINTIYLVKQYFNNGKQRFIVTAVCMKCLCQVVLFHFIVILLAKMYIFGW